MRILSTPDTRTDIRGQILIKCYIFRVSLPTYVFIKILSCFLDDLQELARKEILDLIERLLLEADLDSELSKLEVYGKNLDGIKEFLKHLLIDPNTGK